MRQKTHKKPKSDNDYSFRKGGLDRSLEEAKQKGLSFAELQIQKTLAMVRGSGTGGRL